jgi:hypothetical protein
MPAVCETLPKTGGAGTHPDHQHLRRNAIRYQSRIHPEPVDRLKCSTPEAGTIPACGQRYNLAGQFVRKAWQIDLRFAVKSEGFRI